MKIQAFFWDYDNTILETAEAHWNKHVAVLARHGIVLSEVFRQRVYENNGNQNWEWMKNELGLQIPEKEYLKAIDAEFQRHMFNLKMRPGIEHLIDVIAAHRIPQAIITNARRDSAEPVLAQKGILSKMSFVLYKEDYEGRKPDPAPYLKGFERMEKCLGQPIIPACCIAVEDDPKGVESAGKAGAIVIHRKLSEGMEDSAFANYSCFHEKDLIALILPLIEP
jgi:HAD superfamily hydrolase (TIGR01509 family)